jgi:hypothetical protein
MCGRRWCFPTGSAAVPTALIQWAAGSSGEHGDGCGPAPVRDHAHRFRTTVPCPPGHDIGQLADLVPGPAGNGESSGDLHESRQDRSASGTPHALGPKVALACWSAGDGSGARLVGGGRVSDGGVAGLDLLDRWLPSGWSRRGVLAVWHSGLERGALRWWSMLMACGGAGIGQLADGPGPPGPGR